MPQTDARSMALIGIVTLETLCFSGRFRTRAKIRNLRACEGSHRNLCRDRHNLVTRGEAPCCRDETHAEEQDTECRSPLSYRFPVGAERETGIEARRDTRGVGGCRL